MKRFNFLAIASIVAIGFSFSSFAQKEEIKAFQEMNKDLIKAVKKQYKKDPKVELKDGNFFLVIEGKVNKQKKMMVLNEEGTLLTPEPVSIYNAIDKNYVWIGQTIGNKTYWGVAEYKTGNQIIEPRYTAINLHYKNDEGKNEKGVWRAASEECWVAYDEANKQTRFLSADGKNTLNTARGQYVILKDSYVKVGEKNAYGLYTFNGSQIYPQSYGDFIIADDGFVISTRKAIATFYGGKSINPSLPQYKINDDLLALKWENGVPYYKVHKDDDWANYSLNPDYKVEYVDQGQRFYDLGENEKVIVYYEGEGMDAPHGGYYMGLASKNIADVEFAKLELTIRTLKDPKDYYFPIKYPESYSFNSMILGSQYITAQDYLDRFIKNTDVDPNDPRIKKAKKFRGEAAASKTSIARKLEEYGDALTAASKKYAIDQQNAAIRQAEAEALSNSIASGITSLLFGK